MRVGKLHQQQVGGSLLLVQAHFRKGLRRIGTLRQQIEIFVVERLLFDVALQIHVSLHNIGVILGHVVQEALGQLAVVVAAGIREEAAGIGVRILSGHQVAQLVSGDGDAQRLHLGIERHGIHQLIVDVVPQLVFLLMGEGPTVLLADQIMVMIVFFLELQVGNFGFSHLDETAVGLVARLLQIAHDERKKCKSHND